MKNDFYMVLERCKAGEISIEDALNQPRIPKYEYTEFIFRELLPKNDVNLKDLAGELEAASEPFFQQMIQDLCANKVTERKQTFALMNEIGFKFIKDFFPEIQGVDLSKVPQPKFLGPFIIVDNRIPQPENLWEFAVALMHHPNKNHQEWFDALAHCLMNRLFLKFGKNYFRITECEFYYHNNSDHTDPYVHCGDEQLESGGFYFNKVGGIDLTFGDRSKNIYGGILIRGLKNLIANEENLTENGYVNKVTYVTQTLISGLKSIVGSSAEVRFYNVLSGYYGEEKPVTPIRSKRIGLTKKDSDKDDFISRPYRYIVDLVPKHKFADKEKIVKDLLITGSIERDQVTKIMGYDLKSL